MGFTLLELETTVIQLPRAASGAFNAPNSPVVHRACRWAAEKFLRTTKCSRALVSIAIDDGDSSVDVTSTATDFEPGCLLSPPWITASGRRLKQVDLAYLLDRRGSGGSEGEPSLICWTTRAAAEIYPAAGDDYTMKLLYYKPNVSFDPGDSGVTIDIPARYLGAVALGALGYLMVDFPGAKGRDAMAMFENEMHVAKGELTPMSVVVGGAGVGSDLDQFV